MKFDADLILQKRKEIPYSIKNYGSAVKEIDTTGRTVDVIVNTLNYFDYDFDVLLSGCANKSMKERGAKSDAPDKIVHLLQHQFSKMVGKSLNESEEEIDGKKVLVCQSYLPETTDGDDTLTKYQVGMYNQHSIGFRYINITHIEKGATGWDKFVNGLINPKDADEVGYAYIVKEIKWWEYSTVTFGANKLTPYLGTKSEKKFDVASILSQKIAILATKAMHREIKNKQAFDFELAQLQKMIFELSEMDPHVKGTIEPPSTGSREGLELKGFINKLKF